MALEQKQRVAGRRCACLGLERPVCICMRLSRAEAACVGLKRPVCICMRCAAAVCVPLWPYRAVCVGAGSPICWGQGSRSIRVRMRSAAAAHVCGPTGRIVLHRL